MMSHVMMAKSNVTEDMLTFFGAMVRKPSESPTPPAMRRHLQRFQDTKRPSW
jgi:hypothetical protein